MKRILITGKDSYIGTSVEAYLNRWPDKYSVAVIDVRGGEIGMISPSKIMIRSAM